MFSIRIAIAVLRAGVTDSQGWPTNCWTAAGWWPCATSSTSSSRSADMLKGAHRVTLACGVFVEANPIYATPFILADIDPLLADTHAFEEFRFLGHCVPGQPH